MKGPYLAIHKDEQLIELGPNRKLGLVLVVGKKWRYVVSELVGFGISRECYVQHIINGGPTKSMQMYNQKEAIQ